MTATPHSNADLDEKLVDLVRANPMLYEKELRTSPYESMKRKTELWKSIATSLGVETNYCIIRWKNLRDKFRRELQKSRSMERKAGGAQNRGSSWHLLDKMRFIERHVKYYNSNTKTLQSEKASWNNMDAEDLIEQIIDDDPLQEAMDEQSATIAVDKIPTSTTTTTTTASGGARVSIKRIEALLEGLDGDNRIKAEKRIVAYLCKCQLNVLNNVDIDHVAI